MCKYVELVMKNITLAIEETLLDDARALAEKRKTSLNAMVRSLLAEEIEQEGRIAAARRGLMELIDKSEGTLPPGYVFNRQEIYEERERRLFSRHQHPDLRRDGQDE
jgi:hypothetical protein